MKIIILNTSKYAKYNDRSNFPLGDLKIKVCGLPAVLNAQYRMITWLNGTKIGQYTISAENNVVELAASSLEAGVLSAAIIQYIAGVESKRWEVEQLVITDLDDSLTAIPELEKMSEEIAAIKKDCGAQTAALKEEIKAVKQKCNDCVDVIDALIGFAYDDYKSNVYLDGSADKTEFYQKYGIATILKFDLEDKTDE